MRISALHQLEAQRKIDRCLYPYLEARCTTLTRISETNQTLRRIMHTVATIQATRLIPGVNAAAVTLGQAAIKTARITAKGIAKYQDFILSIEKTGAVTAFRCGIPMPRTRKLALVRALSLEAKATKVPAPLIWQDPDNRGELHLRSWNLAVESFGHCRAKTGVDLLDGEKYEVRFTHAARLPLKASSFLPSF